MKAVELRKKSADELRQLLQGKLLRMEELRTLLAQKKAKNVKELGLVRRDIARILTIISELRISSKPMNSQIRSGSAIR